MHTGHPRSSLPPPVVLDDAKLNAAASIVAHSGMTTGQAQAALSDLFFDGEVYIAPIQISAVRRIADDRVCEHSIAKVLAVWAPHGLTRERLLQLPLKPFVMDNLPPLAPRFLPLMEPMRGLQMAQPLR